MITPTITLTIDEYDELLIQSNNLVSRAHARSKALVAALSLIAEHRSGGLTNTPELKERHEMIQTAREAVEVYYANKVTT